MSNTEITLEENELLICTIHPKQSSPNDAMTCESNGTGSPTYYIKKNNSLLIKDAQKIEIKIIEHDRERGIDRLTIQKNKGYTEPVNSLTEKLKHDRGGFDFS